MEIFETILALHRERGWQKAIPLVGAYRNLTEEQGRELATLAIAFIDETYNDIDRSEASKTARDVLLHLACLVPGALVGTHAILLEKEVFYPPELFLAAPPETSVSLLSELSEAVQSVPESSLPNWLLMDLAWIGDANVVRAFRQWHEVPPFWRTHLFLAPEDYAHEAGWHLTEAGEKRLLYNPVCHALVSSEGISNHAKPGPVSILAPGEEICHWCGRQLTNLFDFNLRDARIAFLSIEGTRLRIAMCERCTVYQSIFLYADPEGDIQWHKANARPEWLRTDEEIGSSWPQVRLVFGPPRRSPFEAHQFVLYDAGSSQVGGHPMWIHDAEYPICPDCCQPMPYLGHVAEADFDRFGDGVWYAFYCATCQVANVGYQSS